MSTLTTTYTLDGVPIEPTTIEAWRALDKHVEALRALFDAFPVGLVPDEVRITYEATRASLDAVMRQTTGVTVEARRIERVTHNASGLQVLEMAKDEARFKGVIE